MPKWTFERVITLAGILVTIGIQVQVVRGLQAQIEHLEAQEVEVSKTYVQREVYDRDRQYLGETITRLTNTLEKLYAIETQTGEPARIQGDEQRGRYNR